jgi:Ring finger domain
MSQNSSDFNSTQFPGLLRHSSEPFDLSTVVVMVGAFCVLVAVVLTLRYRPAPTRQNRGVETASTAALRREREEKRLEYVRAVLKTWSWHGAASSMGHHGLPPSKPAGDAPPLKVSSGDSDGRNDKVAAFTRQSQHGQKDASELESDAANDDVESNHKVDATRTCPDAEDFDAREEHDGVTECAICLCPFAESDRVCEANNAKCMHMYHQECLEPWLLRHEQCPVCREAYLLTSGGEGNSKSK